MGDRPYRIRNGCKTRPFRLRQPYQLYEEGFYYNSSILVEVKWWKKSIIAVELVAQLIAALSSNGATFLVKLVIMTIDLALLTKHTYDFY